jgi:hypothetical protein
MAHGSTAQVPSLSDPCFPASSPASPGGKRGWDGQLVTALASDHGLQQQGDGAVGNASSDTAGELISMIQRMCSAQRTPLICADVAGVAQDSGLGFDSTP